MSNVPEGSSSMIPDGFREWEEKFDGSFALGKKEGDQRPYFYAPSPLACLESSVEQKKLGAKIIKAACILLGLEEKLIFNDGNYVRLETAVGELKAALFFKELKHLVSLNSNAEPNEEEYGFLQLRPAVQLDLLEKRLEVTLPEHLIYSNRNHLIRAIVRQIKIAIENRRSKETQLAQVHVATRRGVLQRLLEHPMIAGLMQFLRGDLHDTEHSPSLQNADIENLVTNAVYSMLRIRRSGKLSFPVSQHVLPDDLADALEGLKTEPAYFVPVDERGSKRFISWFPTADTPESSVFEYFEGVYVQDGQEKTRTFILLPLVFESLNDEQKKECLKKVGIGPNADIIERFSRRTFLRCAAGKYLDREEVFCDFEPKLTKQAGDLPLGAKPLEGASAGIYEWPLWGKNEGKMGLLSQLSPGIRLNDLFKSPFLKVLVQKAKEEGLSGELEEEMKIMDWHGRQGLFFPRTLPLSAVTRMTEIANELAESGDYIFEQLTVYERIYRIYDLKQAGTLNDRDQIFFMKFSAPEKKWLDSLQTVQDLTAEGNEEYNYLKRMFRYKTMFPFFKQKVKWLEIDGEWYFRLQDKLSPFLMATFEYLMAERPLPPKLIDLFLKFFFQQDTQLQADHQANKGPNDPNAITSMFSGASVFSHHPKMLPEATVQTQEGEIE